jgi:hypothetical protein
MDITSKDQALEFLKELEQALNKKLPGPTEMELWVRRTVAAAKTDDKQKHLRLPEAAFLNVQALPVLSELLKTYGGGLSTGDARRALLSESHRGTPDIALGSPIHWVRHPFQKVMGTKPGDIYRGWADPENGHGLAQSCPDFALRDPFPHSILFEGKYFPTGSLEFAQRQLVALIYQAFFYRGLPRLAASKRLKHPEWSYDYACLLAYDASPKATLSSAWKGLNARTQHGFWDGANVYVMILHGSA